MRSSFDERRPVRPPASDVASAPQRVVETDGSASQNGGLFRRHLVPLTQRPGISEAEG